MDLSVYDLGIVLTVIGIGLGLWKGKRKFDRTNSAGVEQFRSFGRKTVATAFDELLSWLSLAFLGVGLLIFAS